MRLNSLFILSVFCITLFGGCDILARGDYDDYLERVNNLFTYTISYSSNGDAAVEGTAPIDSEIYLEGKTATVKDQGDFYKPYYTFTGWNQDSGSDVVEYSAGDSFTFPATDIIFYALWTIDNYTVTYNGNGNTEGSIPGSQSSTHEVSIVLGDQGDLEKTGFYYGGWNTQSGGGGSYYSAGETVSLSRNMTLYAYWNAKPVYSIIYDGNVFTGGDAPESQIKIEGDDVILQDPGSLEKEYYTFSSWNTAADGTGTSYSSGDTYSSDESITLYAQWTTSVLYDVVYYGNGYTDGIAPDSQIKIDGDDMILQDQGTLEKEYYTFSGWNTAADGTGTSYSSGDTYSANEAVTLYAQWERLEGDGDSVPYWIDSVDNFMVLVGDSSGWGAKYVLTGDIDLDGKTYTPIGNETTPFTGTFDGGGYSISNLTISGLAEKHIGLFGNLAKSGGSDPVITNINLEDYSISVESTESQYIGALVGYGGNTAVSNCSSGGTMTVGSVSSTAYIGGLVGYSRAGSQNTECYSNGSIDLTGIDGVTVHVGGLIGYDWLTNTYNCYSTVEITGDCGNLNTYNAGGLIGKAVDTNIDNNYATGTVRMTASPPSTSYLSGLIGDMNDHHINNSIAFNDTLTCSGSSYRISVFNDADSLTGNYAYSGMTSDGSTFTSEIGGTERNGAHMDSSSFIDSTFIFTTMGWSSDIWEIKDGAIRPTLINTGDDDGTVMRD